MAARRSQAAARGPLALVGDVGGTRARLAIYELGERPARRAETVLPSQEAASLVELLSGWLAGRRVDVAVLGVAAPVVDGAAKLTNLPWPALSEAELAHAVGARRARLVNDLAAAARGCLALGRRDLTALSGGPPHVAGRSAAVLAAGTGLGEARMHWTGEGHLVLPTEAGHQDFAPRTPLEVEIWHYARTRFPDQVSRERLVSGAGLGLLFDFFVAQGARPSRAVQRALDAAEDRNVAIAELGVARRSRAAARAVDAFVQLYGAEAGNLALHELARGGVFVVGAIARALVPPRRALFVEAFLAKGRFRPLLETIPLALVDDPMVARKGALAIAAELAA